MALGKVVEEKNQERERLRSYRVFFANANAK
jgi:hypothetical protein